jgi:hypothetical protein
VVYVLQFLTNGQRVTPDGIMYLSLSRKERVPSPYYRRWLLPLILGPSVTSWRIADFVLNFLVLLTTYTLTLQATGMPLLGVVATLLLVSLPMFRLWVNYPVLVDRAGFLLLLLIILSDRSGASFLIPLLLCFIASHRITSDIIRQGGELHFRDPEGFRVAQESGEISRRTPSSGDVGRGGSIASVGPATVRVTGSSNPAHDGEYTYDPVYFGWVRTNDSGERHSEAVPVGGTGPTGSCGLCAVLPAGEYCLSCTNATRDEPLGSEGASLMTAIEQTQAEPSSGIHHQNQWEICDDMGTWNRTLRYSLSS